MRAPHLLGLAVSALLCVRCGPVCDVDADCGQGERCVDGYCGSTNSGGGAAQGNLPVSPPTAAASDAIGVASVDFLVDGALVGTASAAPFAVTWHTTGVPNGSHAISAIARDAAGNSGTSSAIPVRVLNAYGALVSIHTAL